MMTFVSGSGSETANLVENIPVSGTGSSTTPHIGKLGSATLGRFLTPTQTSNMTPNGFSTISQSKKGIGSASKAMTLPRIGAAKLKATNSATTGSAKTLSRENSADDVRKGLTLNEERKKQRELKHLQAAQQREAKERIRAERIAKLAKEREEKLLAKKQAEAEQRKREQEEMRKLRQQQEILEQENKKKTAKIKEQEREMLAQLKGTPSKGASAQRVGAMLPPPPKPQNKYCFEMLQEYDSTDDEDKTSYKRPLPPTWSRREARGPAILMQQHFPTSVIDNFFSVKPMTIDLREIFPDIDKRHLKRNSSALWTTPPRYSELPKY